MEQHGRRISRDAWLDRGMQESFLVPSSASGVSAASTDLFIGSIGREKQYKAKQFDDVKNTGPEIGPWWWKHQRQKLVTEPTRETQEELGPNTSSRCHQPPDDYG